MSERQPTRIVFVTGASRSGTTMLARMLGNHPQILGLRELQYFGELCPADPTRDLSDQEIERLAAVIFARAARHYWDADPTKSERDRARQLRESLGPAERTGHGLFPAALTQLATECGKSVVCEQTPRNIFYASEILDATPDARFIHIVRDPRAVVASQKNRWKMRSLGARHLPVSEVIRTWINYHPVTMSRLWVSATAAALRLVDDPRLMLVRFEDLLATPEDCMRAVCDFVRVPFDCGMLSVPRWGSSNVRHDGDRTELSKDVLEQWETVLTPPEIGIVERIAGDLMRRFDYAPRTSAEHRGGRSLRHSLSYPLHLAGVALANPRRALIQARAMLVNVDRRR